MMTTKIDLSGSPLKICLTGGWFSSNNVGDNAILDGICDSIRKHGEATFEVLSSSPETVEALHGIQAFAPKRSPLGVLKSVASADALFFTGGTPFYDEIAHMGYFAALATVAKMAKTPVVVFGISLRTLDKVLNRYLTSRICSQSRYVAGREKKSVERLNLLTPNHDEVHLLPDPATQMLPETNDWAQEELATLGIHNDRPALAICLRDFGSPSSFRSAHYTRNYSTDEIENLIHSIQTLAAHVVKDFHHDVVLFPMNTKAPDDDRVPSTQVFEGIQDAAIRKHVHVVNHQYSARQMKALLGAMNVVVGIRFHSLVLSASMNVPNYAIGYAPKNAAIMDFYGRNRYMQTIDRLDSTQLLHDIDDIILNREAQSRELTVWNEKINEDYDMELQKVLNILQMEKHK